MNLSEFMEVLRDAEKYKVTQRAVVLFGSGGGKGDVHLPRIEYIDIIVDAALGQTCDNDTVLEACGWYLEWYFGGKLPDSSDNFWSSPMGWCWASVWAKASGHRLITPIKHSEREGITRTAAYRPASHRYLVSHPIFRKKYVVEGLG